MRWAQIERAVPIFIYLGMEKAQTQSAKKGVFKKHELCYSVDEAYGSFSSRFAGTTSAWANGQKESRDEGFNNGWRYISPEELSADMYSSREIGFIGIFSVFLLNENLRGDQFGEVVHDQTGKDFLENVLHFFCVEMQQANSILQIPKRGFYPPAHRIDIFQLKW